MAQQQVHKKRFTKGQLIAFWVSLSVVLFVLIIVCFGFWFSNYQKNEALTYLEKKYGQTFIIKSEQIHFATESFNLQIDLVIVPIDNPMIESDYSNIIGSNNGRIVDNYLGIVWKQQASGGLKDFLSSIYGSDDLPRYTQNYIASSAFVNQYNEGKTLNIHQAVSKYGTDISNNTLSIKVTNDYSTIDLNDNAQKFISIMSFLQSSGLQTIDLNYNISTPKQYVYSCEMNGKQALAGMNVEGVIKCFKKGLNVNYNN